MPTYERIISDSDRTDLAAMVVKLAARWMFRCGFTMRNRNHFSALDAAIGMRDDTAEMRVLRAAACDLYDTLCATAEGRKALLDLGFEPVAQNAEGE